jgi:hypothetical protein
MRLLASCVATHITVDKNGSATITYISDKEGNKDTLIFDKSQLDTAWIIYNDDGEPQGYSLVYFGLMLDWKFTYYLEGDNNDTR